MCCKVPAGAARAEAFGDIPNPFESLMKPPDTPAADGQQAVAGAGQGPLMLHDLPDPET